MPFFRSVEPLLESIPNHKITTMGDKSPKSKNKDDKQKQGKNAASDKAKQKMIADKQTSQAAVPKKKK